MREYIFRQLGNLCYRLNGGLQNLHNESFLERATFYWWTKSYQQTIRR